MEWLPLLPSPVLVAVGGGGDGGGLSVHTHSKSVQLGVEKDGGDAMLGSGVQQIKKATGRRVPPFPLFSLLLFLLYRSIVVNHGYTLFKPSVR